MTIKVKLRQRLQPGLGMDIKHADGNSMAAVDVPTLFAEILKLLASADVRVNSLFAVNSIESGGDIQADGQLVVSGNAEVDGDTIVNGLTVNGDLVISDISASPVASTPVETCDPGGTINVITVP